MTISQAKFAGTDDVRASLIYTQVMNRGSIGVPPPSEACQKAIEAWNATTTRDAVFGNAPPNRRIDPDYPHAASNCLQARPESAYVGNHEWNH